MMKRQLVHTQTEFTPNGDTHYYESNFILDIDRIIKDAEDRAVHDMLTKRMNVTCGLPKVDEDKITYNKYGTNIYKDRFKSSVTNPSNPINQAFFKLNKLDLHADCDVIGNIVNKICMDMTHEAIKKEEEKLTMNCLAEKVIFNPPATIVFWKDGTKTVVKCQDGDLFDPEKGLVMAYFKRLHGNRGNYYNVIKKFVGDYPTPKFDTDDEVLSEILNEIATFIVTGKTPEMLKPSERHEWDDMPVPVIREAFDKGILNWDELDKIEYKVDSDQSKVKVEYKNGAKAVFDFSGVRSDNE